MTCKCCKELKYLANEHEGEISPYWCVDKQAFVLKHIVQENGIDPFCKLEVNRGK